MWDSINKKENQSEQKFQTISSSVDKCFRLRLLFEWIFFYSIETNICEIQINKKENQSEHKLVENNISQGVWI